MPLSGIGFGEMLVIAMLVLIVFGPQRLPEITRSVGKAMREFKRGMNEIQRELEVADRQQKWNDTSKASSRRAGAAAAGAATAASAATAGSASGSSGEAAETAAGGAAEASQASGEPMIAPPTFGSDLPDEIQSQLAPLPTETGVNPRRATPEPPARPQGEASGRPDTADGGSAKRSAAPSDEGTPADEANDETAESSRGAAAQ